MIKFIKTSFFLAIQLMILSVCLAQPFDRIENIAIPANIANNLGIAVADYNADGYLDIFMVKNGQSDPSNTNILLKNTGEGSFVNVSVESGLFNSTANFGASWADYDNDGDPDLYITGLSQNQLYRNEGDGTFTDVTEFAGLGGFCTNCLNLFTGSLWWDYDYDGDLDLYVTANFIQPIQYINNGDGTFSKTLLGTEYNLFFSFCAIPLDFNNDNILDLYVTNDFDLDNFLFINDKVSFTESASVYGVEDPFDGMGLAICDYDNNGFFDFGVTNIAENAFFSNNGTSFTNLSQDLNIYNTGWAWGLVFSDFDLDGYEDLFVVNGINDNFTNQLFRNVADGTSRTFVSNNEQIDENVDMESRGVVSFDYDNDGDLDIIVTNNFDVPHFFENKVDQASVNAYIKILLEGTVSNRDAIGAVVKVKTADGTQYRLNQGVGFLSQSQIPLHFGLNQSTIIELLTVEWPSGVIEEYSNVPVNSTIKVTENNNYVVLNSNPAVKILGCTNVNSCNYNPAATSDDGSCQFLPPGTINGQAISNPLSIESYSYTSADVMTSFDWSVSNGHIMDGQGTESITVQWEISEAGTVLLTAGDANCLTEQMDFAVTIELSHETSTSKFENYSVARLWSEVLLEAIRKDFARPTVHARNLFHSSVAMYDAWAIYNQRATYLIGNQVHGYQSSFNAFSSNIEGDSALHITISYAAYRLLTHRFQNSPGLAETQQKFDELMNLLGYSISVQSIDYSDGDPAKLGNYIAAEVINYGMLDGSNEADGYANINYLPVNDPLDPKLDGNTTISDPNRWQPLQLELFIDQSGNLIRGDVPEFLGPEWGNVWPFSLDETDMDMFQRDNADYRVYFDPGIPPYLSASNATTSEWYQWGFSMVSVWGSHLSPDDGVMVDISPRSIGNIAISQLPTNFGDFDQFYNLLDGGDIGLGRTMNPVTGQAYEPQIVPRGDYARVLAEFWADGPDSETPPGHWFTLLNYINDQASLEKKINGEGDVLGNLEWDLKSYFTLGGAMHDAAIAAWGVKGWYDYIRPISAIRYMAELGQSTDILLPNYNKLGIPLIDGYIAVVDDLDPLAGDLNENVGKIKLYTWRGHDFITFTATDEAGVGWILAEDWWPYQRPSFVTPPFAGYVSGHSTFSRAAADVLTLFTGSEYFPGGMGTFLAKKDEFLVFEDGPSQDIILQWATYQDASDQCSLSRIWGGIHPPADDIPGRIIGEKLGKVAFADAMLLFDRIVLRADGEKEELPIYVYPNPVDNTNIVHIAGVERDQQFELIGLNGVIIPITVSAYDTGSRSYSIKLGVLRPGMYILRSQSRTWKIVKM